MDTGDPMLLEDEVPVGEGPTPWTIGNVCSDNLGCIKIYHSLCRSNSPAFHGDSD